MKINNVEWKPVIIDGERTPYIASELGNIYNIETDHMMTPSKLQHSGRLRVCLRWNGKKKDFKVHRLVYEAFNGPIPKDMTVDHIDEDINNNCLSNLQLLTPSENIKKYYRLHPDKGFQKNYPDELIINFLKKCKKGEYFKDAANELNIPITVAKQIITGKRRKILYEIYKPFPVTAFTNQKIDKSIIDKIKSMLLDGYNSREILQRIDVCYNDIGIKLINDIRAELGLKIKDTVTKEESDEIEYLILQKFNNKEIYDIMGFEYSEKISRLIWRKRKRLGIMNRRYNMPEEDCKYIVKMIEEGKNNEEILKPIGKYYDQYYYQFCNDVRRRGIKKI